MKRIAGVLLLASTIGLALAATSSAAVDSTSASCAGLEAAILADVAAAKNAARVGDAAAEIRLSKEIIGLTASAKAACAAGTAPAEFSTKGLPEAKLGQPYKPITFCTRLVSRGTQCDNADGKLITFEIEGDLLPLGMRFDSFTGTISGTPRLGQGTPRYIKVQVCSRELLKAPTDCIPTTLFLTK